MADQSKIKEQVKVDDLDSLLAPLGGFGKFQIVVITCLCLIIWLCSFSEIAYVFTAGDVKHRCLIPECEAGNATWGVDNKPWLPYYIPKTSSGSYDSCLRFVSKSSSCDITSVTNTTVKCENFVYESEERTITREGWGTDCDCDKYKLNLVGSLNSVGQVIGSLYVGYISDRFGRKVIIYTSLVVAVIGIIKTFSINYAMMIAFEIIESSVAVSLFNGAFVMALEIVEPSKRVLAGTLASISYAVGEMLLGLAQYLTLDWQNTIRIMFAPFFLVFALYWVIPESARWLLNKQRPDEAVAVLRKIAKMNGTTLDMQQVKQVLANEVTKNKNSGNDGKEVFANLWRSKIMRMRVIASYFTWLCGTFVYFGMTLNSVSVNDDKFVNFILTSFVEIPGYLATLLILDRWGRRISLCASFLLCGVSCVLDAFVPSDDSWSWAIVVFYLLGKFGITISFFTIDIYTTEIFPTSLRSTMMSTGLLFGKIAGIVAPEVPLLADIYKPLPLLIFGGMSLAAGFVSLVFPETLNCRLPDTIEEAENLGKPSTRQVTSL